jgi:hypothetical protein
MGKVINETITRKMELGKDIVRDTKQQRLTWYSHVTRLQDDKLDK